MKKCSREKACHTWFLGNTVVSEDLRTCDQGALHLNRYFRDWQGVKEHLLWTLNVKKHTNVDRDGHDISNETLKSAPQGRAEDERPHVIQKRQTLQQLRVCWLCGHPGSFRIAEARE